MSSNEPSAGHFLSFDMGSSGKGADISEPGMTKREFLKFCGTSFCALAVSHLFGFSGAVRAQMAQKGLIKTKLPPYFTSLSTTMYS